jgi:hypothetical protein
VKVIFSRKGYDSQAGGCASPIIDGRPYSLPIPAGTPTPTRYGDLARDIGKIVRDLTGGRIVPGDACHLDPDIDKVALAARLPGWRGCFGQVGASQAHLERQGVGVGDLFLFWGLFRTAERSSDGRWVFTGPPEHRVFGWLQVGEVHYVGCDGSTILDRHPWLRDHLHARDGWTRQNTLYVAREELDLPGCKRATPGWGVFARGRRLTAAGKRVSLWSVPVWLDPTRGGTGMSYHGRRERWDAEAGQLSCVGRGQEFVADIGNRADALEWLAALWAEDGG